MQADRQGADWQQCVHTHFQKALLEINVICRASTVDKMFAYNMAMRPVISVGPNELHVIQFDSIRLDAMV